MVHEILDGSIKSALPKGLFRNYRCSIGATSVPAKRKAPVSVNGGNLQAAALDGTQISLNIFVTTAGLLCEYHVKVLAAVPEPLKDRPAGIRLLQEMRKVVHKKTTFREAAEHLTD